MSDRIIILKTTVINEGEKIHPAAKIVAYATVTGADTATHAVYFVTSWGVRCRTCITPIENYRPKNRELSDVYYVKDLKRSGLEVQR